ncbi:hypothetical protein Taro_010088 [Colocasia esculenta]|uniref:CASP-like protein n=1 Tax=Colocasia esculenta TaxID=4460 RepID=A0A843U6P2_COLES|nr:hypothetical protein [Colocasia esculenta]
MSGETSATTITIGDAAAKADSAAALPPPPASATRAAPFTAFMSKSKAKGGWRRGIFCFDFLVRIFAIGACLAAAILMGTNDETLPFFTHDFQFHAQFDDLPTFTLDAQNLHDHHINVHARGRWFMVANAIAGGYLVLSIPFSFFSIVRPHALGLRLLLLILDTVMLAFTCAAAASAAAIVYLAHTGNVKANWVGICLQFNDFCQQSSGAVVASFVATVLFMVLVVMSALALRKH